MKKICETYAQAKVMENNGTIVVSLDEKTGIQALERLHPDIAPQAGKTRLREYEYIRHGTMTLIAGKSVAQGTIFPYLMGATRNEADFLKFIQQIVATDPGKNWIFIADQLNTHKSASLVEWIAKNIQFKEDLGRKGKDGILKNLETRKLFLEDQDHAIRFLFTPKHCSWLNQIESWFSQLGSRVINKGDFSSTHDLQTKISRYIDYFNRCLAKPFNWKYSGERIYDLLS